MTISLGILTLSNDLIWKNEFASPAIGQSVMITIGGSVHVHTDPLNGGREIVLGTQFKNNALYGYFTRSQIQTISEYERNGTTVELVYEDQSFNVKVKAGGIDVEPLLAKAGQGVDDYYSGNVTLIEV
ncbi:MAG: hypothetical protein WCS33_01985 [Candidatus Caldatribacteriota bacterium]|jgi:hypothetical protein